MKVKGEIEQVVSKIGIEKLAVFQPGLLTKRDNDFRLGEWFLKYVPFVPKIDATNVGLVMLSHAIQAVLGNIMKGVNILTLNHKQMGHYLEYARQNKVL